MNFSRQVVYDVETKKKPLVLRVSFFRLPDVSWLVGIRTAYKFDVGELIDYYKVFTPLNVYP